MINLPKEILFEKYAEQGFFWQGQVSTEELPRVQDAVETPSRLQVSCRLDKQAGLIWLKFGVVGELSLACHRCLSPMPFVVAGDYRTAILTDDSQLALVEDEDYVFVNDFVDVRYLPLLSLLEDELLLALPLSSTHQDCTLPVELPEIIDDEPKENPFSVLAQLKTKN